MVRNIQLEIIGEIRGSPGRTDHKPYRPKQKNGTSEQIAGTHRRLTRSHKL